METKSLLLLLLAISFIWQFSRHVVHHQSHLLSHGYSCLNSIVGISFICKIHWIMLGFVGIRYCLQYFTFLSTLICMTSQTVIELLLVSIQAGIGPCQAVHLASQTILHVSLIVEVGHVPAILLVIVVVGVGAEINRHFRICWKKMNNNFSRECLCSFFLKMIHRILYEKASKNLFNIVLAKIGFHSIEYPFSFDPINNDRS